MEKWGKIAAVSLVVLFLAGVFVAGCRGRHPNGNPVFVASYSTLLADDGWALSANGQSLVMPPRVFYRDNGDGIVLFVTGPARPKNGAPKSRTGTAAAPGATPNGVPNGGYYTLWASYYNMRERILQPPVEIRGENADFHDMPDLPGIVVMFYGGANYASALYPKGFSPGDAIILYKQRDIDTDTENTAGNAKGPNRRLYYCRFTRAHVERRDLGYGFGHGTNAAMVDANDGAYKTGTPHGLFFFLREDVLSYGAVTDGLVGGAAFTYSPGETVVFTSTPGSTTAPGFTVNGNGSPGLSAYYTSYYDQTDFSDYFAAVWVQCTDVSDVTTVWVEDLKLYRSRFDLSTGTFEAPEEILPDAESQDSAAHPEYTWITSAQLANPPFIPTLFCYNRSVFFESLDIAGPTGQRDEALNWNRLEGTFTGPTDASPGAMSGDFGTAPGASRTRTSLLISPTRNSNWVEYIDGIRINNIYGGDDDLTRQYIYYIYEDNGTGNDTKSLLVSQVSPCDASFVFSQVTDVTEMDVSVSRDVHYNWFDTRLSRKGGYIAAAFLQDDNSDGRNSLFVRELPTAPSVLTPLPAAQINDATADPVNCFEFQRELRHDWTGRNLGIQSENGYMHILYEQSTLGDATDVLYTARYISMTGAGVTPIPTVERAEVARSNGGDFSAAYGSDRFSVYYSIRRTFALDDDESGVIVYWRGNSTFGTGKDAEYRAFAARYGGGFSSGGIVPINIGSSAVGAANGRQVRDLWGFTIKKHGANGDFHGISILEDREERNNPSLTTTLAWRQRWLRKGMAFNTDAFYPKAASGGNTPDEPVLVDTGIDADVKPVDMTSPGLGPAAFPGIGLSAYAGTHNHSVALGQLVGLYFEHSGHLYYRELLLWTNTKTCTYWLDDLSPTNIDGYWVFGWRNGDSSRYPMLAGALAFYAKRDPATQDLRLFLRIRNLWFE
jgi:hypothetical protein